MGNPAGKPADRIHSLQLANLLFAPLRLADVAHDRQDEGGLPLAIGDRHHPCLDRAGPARGRQDPVGQHLGLARSGDPFVGLDDLSAFLRWKEVGLDAPDDPVPASSKQLLAGRVDQKIAESLAARLLQEDHVRNILDDRVEQFAGAADLGGALLDAILKLDIDRSKLVLEPAPPLDLAAADREQPGDRAKA